MQEIHDGSCARYGWNDDFSRSIEGGATKVIVSRIQYDFGGVLPLMTPYQKVCFAVIIDV